MKHSALFFYIMAYGITALPNTRHRSDLDSEYTGVTEVQHDRTSHRTNHRPTSHQQIFEQRHGANAGKGSSQRQILYPEESQNMRPKSENCILGFCENISNYPDHQVKSILKRTPVLQTYLSSVPSITLETRFDKDEPLCSTTEYTMLPQKANNTKNIEKIIVNDDDHKQPLVFTTCISNTNCKYSELFPPNIETSCQQKYAIKRMMTYEQNSDTIALDNFEIPSCCVCVYKKNKM